MGRNTNVEVFEDTEKMCKEHTKLAEGVKKSRAGQKLILEKEPFPTPKLNIYEEKAHVVVSKKRSLEAASAYKGTKTAVHNFASAKNPGGGVVNGASAQEECLRRMLDIAVTEGVESIVLGAFGCGAFMNDPAIVADAAKHVLKDYLYAFKNIEYAVYCSPKNDANYQAFHRALMEYCG